MEIHKDMWPGHILAVLENKITNFRTGNLEVKVQLNVWTSDLINQSAPIFLYRFPDNSAEAQAMKVHLTRKWKIDTTTTTNFSFVLQFMTKDSYIPWHDDTGFNFVSTTYLNKDWKYDWGGAFLYVDEKDELVIEGALYCTECSRYFPIIEEIPIMLPDELRDKKQDIEFLKNNTGSLPEKIVKNGNPWHV